MAKYISQVFVVVEADSVADACDAMTGSLSETLKYNGSIVEWSYSVGPNAGYDLPKLVAEPFQSMDDFEDQDLDALNASAIVDPLIKAPVAA